MSIEAEIEYEAATIDTRAETFVIVSLATRFNQRLRVSRVFRFGQALSSILSAHLKQRSTAVPSATLLAGRDGSACAVVSSRWVICISILGRDRTYLTPAQIGWRRTKTYHTTCIFLDLGIPSLSLQRATPSGAPDVVYDALDTVISKSAL